MFRVNLKILLIREEPDDTVFVQLKCIIGRSGLSTWKYQFSYDH